MTRTTYDEVPYPSHPMRQTHPDHLGTIAHLLGLEPPTPDACQVLELGCASGGNLIPLALTAPHSRIVGVDLSERQVAEGQATIAALGLANIELRAISILDVDDSWGPFDYILCHGVYSWVPPHVQSKILDIYARHLAPHGIGYVSYNTHPGWHMRGVIRHMLSYHVGRYQDESPGVQIARARRLLDFLAHATSGRDRAYATLLQEQAELLRQHSDAYLFHEHLEEHNEPIWFLDFCQRLGERGLRYLAEAEFGMMLPGLSFPEDVQLELAELAPSLLEKEQYMDFVRNRSFRQSLIVHERCRPQYQLRPDRLRQLWVASPVRTPAPPEELTSDDAVEFAGPDGLCLESASPLVKIALQYLGELWPESVLFEELARETVSRLKSALPHEAAERDDALTTTLAQALLTTFARSHGGLLRLALCPAAARRTASERPLASPLARFQATRGLPITNLRHEMVAITPFDRQLLPLADGTRGIADLLNGLCERFQAGALQIAQDEQPVADVTQAREILANVLEQQLPHLARQALWLR